MSAAVLSLSNVAERICSHDLSTTPVGTSVDVEGTIYVGTVTVTAGVVDDAARSLFRQGQCHALALALWEATGWTIVAETSPYCSFDEDCLDMFDDGMCGCQLEHLMVRDPDGWVYDICGQHDPDGVCDDDNELVEVSAGHLDDICVHSRFWRRPDVVLARSFVPHVLASATS